MPNPNVAYIPKVRCAKCAKDVFDIQRLSDGRTRWIRVRCHGKEARISFTTDPDERVTLWASEPTGTQQ